MKRRLFQTLVVSGSGTRKRGRAAVPLSVTLHALGAAALLTLPALTPPALPEPPPARILVEPPVIRLAPSPPAPADPPPARAQRRTRASQASHHAAQPVRVTAIPTDPTGEEDSLPPPDVGGESLCPSCLPGIPLPGPPGPGDGASGASGASGEAPRRIGGDIRPPVKLHHVSPAYPQIAREARVQAVVILECVVNSDGHVTEARVLRGHPLLDGPALEAVRQWRYKPTLLNGVPVPVIMTVTVRFVLA